MDSNEPKSYIAESNDLSSEASGRIDIGDWDGIHKAILQQNVPPGTKTFQYKGRFVPLRGELKPLDSVILSYDTVEGGENHIRSAQNSKTEKNRFQQKIQDVKETVDQKRQTYYFLADKHREQANRKNTAEKPVRNSFGYYNPSWSSASKWVGVRKNASQLPVECAAACSGITTFQDENNSVLLSDSQKSQLASQVKLYRKLIEESEKAAIIRNEPEETTHHAKTVAIAPSEKNDLQKAMGGFRKEILAPLYKRKNVRQELNIIKGLEKVGRIKRKDIIRIRNAVGNIRKTVLESLYCRPSPINQIDKEEWIDIVEAIKQAEICSEIESFKYKGRNVPLVWEEVSLKSLLAEFE